MDHPPLTASRGVLATTVFVRTPDSALIGSLLTVVGSDSAAAEVEVCKGRKRLVEGLLDVARIDTSRVLLGLFNMRPNKLPGG